MPKVTKEDIAAFLAELESKPTPEEPSNSSTTLKKSDLTPSFPSQVDLSALFEQEVKGIEPLPLELPTKELIQKETPKDVPRSPELSRMGKMKEILSRPSIDFSKENLLLKEEKKKEPFPLFKKAPKLKSKPEAQREFIDLHSKQKVVVMLEDLNERCSGYIQVRQGEKEDWRLQFCLLDPTGVFIFQTTPDDKAWRISTAKGFTVEAMEFEGFPYGFKFTSPPDNVFFFGVDSAQERDQWVTTLQKVLITASTSVALRKGSFRDDSVKGAIKVFGESLAQQDKSKAILIDSSQTSAEVVKLVLSKYQVNDNPEKYGLFGRSPEGEEFPINDSELPLVVKSFWESQGIQNVFCIKEKFPNIGLFEHNLVCSDALAKASPLSKEVENFITGNSTDLCDPSLHFLHDPLFGGLPSFNLPSPSSPSLPKPRLLASSSSFIAGELGGIDGELAEGGLENQEEPKEISSEGKNFNVLRLCAFGELEVPELGV